MSQPQPQSQIATVSDPWHKATYIAVIQSTAEWIWQGRPGVIAPPKLDLGDWLKLQSNPLRIFRQ